MIMTKGQSGLKDRVEMDRQTDGGNCIISWANAVSKNLLSFKCNIAANITKTDVASHSHHAALTLSG